MRKVPRLEASCGIPQHTHRSVLLLPGLSKRLRPAVLQRTWKGYALSPSARCDGRSSRLDGQHQERRSMRRLPRGIPRLRDALGPLTRLREGRGREFDGPEPIPGRCIGRGQEVRARVCQLPRSAYDPPAARCDRTDWSASAAEAGWIVAAYQLGYALAVIAVLPLTDRVRSSRVIAAGALATSLANLAFAFGATDVISGSLLRILSGFGLTGVYMP